MLLLDSIATIYLACPAELDSTPRKNVQFSETVTVKTEPVEPREVEIDELQIDRVLHMLDDADPTGERPDPDEMLAAEGTCQSTAR